MNLLNHDETKQVIEEIETFLDDICDRYVSNIQDQGRYDEFDLDYIKLMNLMKNDVKYLLYHVSQDKQYLYLKSNLAESIRDVVQGAGNDGR